MHMQANYGGGADAEEQAVDPKMDRKRKKEATAAASVSYWWNHLTYLDGVTDCVLSRRVTRRPKAKSLLRTARFMSPIYLVTLREMKSKSCSRNSV